MQKTNRIIEILEKIAINLSPNACSRISAAITRRNKIISFGNNERKSHTFHFQFRRNDSSPYFHAETNVIYNALRFNSDIDLSKCDLWICRMKKCPENGDNKFIRGLARPCEGCIQAIKKYEFKNVYYTLDNIDDIAILN
jgi:deoxycytidylate deaminase